MRSSLVGAVADVSPNRATYVTLEQANQDLDLGAQGAAIGLMQLQEAALLAFDKKTGARSTAAAVKATIQRLGVSVNQVAREAGVQQAYCYEWLSRRHLSRPAVREAGGRLLQWHETARHRPTPVAPPPPPAFDEEADARNASAVKATIQRLGITVTQAASEALAPKFADCAGYTQKPKFDISWRKGSSTEAVAVA